LQAEVEYRMRGDENKGTQSEQREMAVTAAREYSSQAPAADP
jgi:hypothetical protein